jgi:hypothetical protein
MSTPLSPDTNTEKAYELIDSNLFYGSSDTFRSAVGGYWYTREIDETGNVIDFESFDWNLPGYKFFNAISANPDLKEAISEDTIIINKRLPIRISATSAYVSNDIHWKRLFLGGSFAGEEISPVYNENLYGYHYCEYPGPYPQIDALAIEGDAISHRIQISYEYNKYLPTYQQHIKTLDSDLLIPNYYVLADLQSIDSGDDINSETYDTSVINYVTLEGEYSGDINTVLSNNDYNPYLTGTLVYGELSSATQEAIEHKFQNIILDNTAVEKLYVGDNIHQYANIFPYYNKITFPLDKPQTLGTTATSVPTTTTPLSDLIVDNNYTTRFLKTLKEVFNGDLPLLQPTEADYVINATYLSSSNGVTETSNVEAAENINLRTVSFIDMLKYTYNNYLSQTDDCYFVGERNIYRDAVMDTIGAYRYMNSIASIETLRDVAYYVRNVDNFEINGLDDYLFQDEKKSWQETVAYRIQKVGGSPTGDAREQNTLQNYWIAGTDSEFPLEEFTFFDTQVKYAENYTYHVYKYVMVVGAKYKFSDLRLTRALSPDNELGSGRYGLEFYDPQTGEVADQLYSDVPDTDYPFLTLSEVSSQYPYLADFYLNYEPSVMIFEIPVLSKTFKVLDNPANNIDIDPYQHLDASQKIGFKAAYETFEKRPFPVTITSNDERLKEEYLHGKDFFDDTLISQELATTAISVDFPEPAREDETVTTYSDKLETVSLPRYIEIYRTEERPTAYVDFSNKLLTTLDLKIKNSDYTYTVDFFDNKIATNKKYYYIFRILNEQRMIGHVSEIYETELVNDGGYVYALFNVLYEEDLVEPAFTQPSKEFKKIFHLQPNISQISLNTTEVDYTAGSYSQVGNVQIGTADHLIWNKKFKIRLTSKKTGKKIDLNITYKLI